MPFFPMHNTERRLFRAVFAEVPCANFFLGRFVAEPAVAALVVFGREMVAYFWRILSWKRGCIGKLRDEHFEEGALCAPLGGEMLDVGLESPPPPTGRDDHLKKIKENLLCPI